MWGGGGKQTCVHTYTEIDLGSLHSSASASSDLTSRHVQCPPYCEKPILLSYLLINPVGQAINYILLLSASSDL